MHKVSGNWKLGLTLSLTTAFLWGLLPIALKGLLLQMDAVTVTWYRFLSAAVLVFLFLALRKRLPSLKQLKGVVGLLMLIAILGLGSNYVFYLVGLELTNPSSAQVMIQTAPMMMLIGGLVIFKEPFSKWQWLGFTTFALGLILFFNLRFGEIFNSLGSYTIGLLWIFAAAVTWATYALAQKQLLNEFSSNQIMFMIYLACVPLLIPISNPEQIMDINGLGWFLLIFCCLNTLVAYGAFAEALAHWEASRVSALLAITPLLTIVFMKICAYFFPDYLIAEPLNALSLIGAGMVVTGSAITALAGRKKSNHS
ncbi:DMT family transporter [Kangiella sp. HZ709]|uniref:DMT family transporter n=1 Tax=Kangiella sp. HZ709 TaxID=2666328 RepID=UPI0012B041CC|nr:DMT family transporter [Kangiella sp. HZ709]MRX27397.1 EamA family transporter [Kangiella sp. HZ709]